jgi:hypothetical protein
MNPHPAYPENVMSERGSHKSQEILVTVTRGL